MGGGGPRMSAGPQMGGGGGARMSAAPRMQGQSRANFQPRANVQTTPRSQMQMQPRGSLQNRSAISQRTLPEFRSRQAGDLGMRSRDLNFNRDRSAVGRTNFDRSNRAQGFANTDRGRGQGADMARADRIGGRTDFQNRGRTGVDRFSGDMRGRGQGMNAPSRGDINRQLGLQNRGGDLQSRASDRPHWVSTGANQGRNAININNVNNSVARAISNPQRQFRGDQFVNRGGRIGDRGRGDWDHGHGGQRWDRWANPVRNNWHTNHHPWFNNQWWAHHAFHHHHDHFLNFFGFGLGPWGWGYLPWTYWWGQPTWSGVTGWFGNGGWYDPWYYDYGYGGNVVYSGDSVYVGDTYVGTPVEYAESAGNLATIPAEVLDQEPTGDWLALGTFAMVANREEVEPTRSIQLAVNKQGIISGAYYDSKQDEAYAVAGRVDPDTQRVAFRIDNNPDIVYETGIYNLTQDQTPILVHDGSQDPATNLLVRLDQPKEEISR